MNADRYARKFEIFKEARQRHGAARDVYVQQECGEDAAMRDEVIELLEAMVASGERGAFAEHEIASVRSSLDTLVEASSEPWNPEQIGRYRIVRQIGRGGMGIVYEAVQDSPRRTVALKVLQPGLVRANTLRRFRRESQILGLLSHPGIANIHDAGTCDLGFGEMPYFAMEFVDGVPLTQYVKQHELDDRAILTVVIRICDAVQHAHERGVIHRDLKPANILVTKGTTGSGGPAPKILDFGIARTTAADQQLSTMQTTTGQLLGTLPYMSPEQLSGREDIDARSDIYSVGVLLYELLTGHVPLDFEGRTLTDIARCVRDDDPVTLGRLNRKYRGDIETICGKALAKERKARYASIADLSDDLHRHLRSEPIAARPSTAWYQIKKLARRHKAIVGGVLATFAVLSAGVIVSLLLLFRAERGEVLAKQNAHAADRGNYIARITAASASVARDPAIAIQLLRDAPPKNRGWEWHWLRARTQPLELAFRPPRGDALDVAFGRDGTPLCLAREGDRAILYDMRSGGEVATLRLASGFDDIFLSRDGTRLGAEHHGEESALLRVHDIASGRLVDERTKPTLQDFAEALDGHAAQFYAAPDFSRISGVSLWLLTPDRTRILKGILHEQFARLIDAKTDAPLVSFVGHQHSIHAAAFTADASRLVSASPLEASVRIWDVDSGRLQRTIFTKNPGRLATSPDASSLAVLSEGRAKLYDLEDQASRRLPLDGYVYSVALDSERGLIAAGTFRGELRIFDAWSGDELARSRSDNSSSISGLAFDPDGRRVHIRSRDEHFDLVRMAFRTGSKAFRDIPNARYGTECTSADGSQRAFRKDTGIVVEHKGRTRSIDRGRRARESGVALHTATNRLAVSREDGSIELYRLSSLEPLGSTRGHIGTIYGLAFTPDGQRLISAGHDQRVRLLDPDSLDELASLRGHTNYVHDLAVSTDGAMLVSGSGDRSVRIWDRRARRERHAQYTRDHSLWRKNSTQVFVWCAALRDPAKVHERIQSIEDPEERVAMTRGLIARLGFEDTDARSEDERREAYFVLVAAAAATWRDDPVFASEYLRRTPHDMRGWEWQWLRDLEVERPTLHSFVHPRRTRVRTTSAVAYDRGGRPLYAHASGGRLTVVDLREAEVVQVFENADGLTDPAFSRDGSRLFAWQIDKGKARHLVEWSIDSGKLTRKTPNCENAGGPILAGSRHHVVWRNQDPPTGEPIHEISLLDLRTGKHQKYDIEAQHVPRFTRDGAKVLCGKYSIVVTSGQISQARPTDILTSPDSRHAVTRAGRAFELRRSNGEKIATLEGHVVSGRALAFSPDSEWVAATLAPSNRIAVWNIATRARRITVAARAVAFSPDGTQLLVATDHGARVLALTAAPSEIDRAPMQSVVAALYERLQRTSAVAGALRDDPGLSPERRRAALEIVFDRRLRELAEGLGR